MILVHKIFFVIGSVFMIASAVYLKTGIFKLIYHDMLGWCQPIESEINYDGCSLHSHCKYCGKEIMQDSQGNWF